MQANQVKEVSIREVILVLQSYLVNGLRRWLWLLVGAALGAAYFAWSATQRTVSYEASTTFVVSKAQGGGGGLGSVLGQIGLGGGGGENNFYRVMNFATSRQLIYRLLLDTVSVDGAQDLMVNHLIDAYHLDEELQLQEGYGLTHLSASEIDSLSIKERALLKMMYGFVTMDKSNPVQKRIDEVTDMLTLVVKTPNEDLSLELVEGLYNSLEAFYKLESTGQSQATVTRLQEKSDSLLTELNRAEYQLATFNDTQMGLMSNRDMLRVNQLNRKIQLLSVAYGELMRNLETAKFTLSTQTPYFQAVDVPFKPLRRINPNPVNDGLMGALYGTVAALVLVSMFHFYQQVMEEPASANN